MAACAILFAARMSEASAITVVFPDPIEPEMRRTRNATASRWSAGLLKASILVRQLNSELIAQSGDVSEIFFRERVSAVEFHHTRARYTERHGGRSCLCR